MDDHCIFIYKKINSFFYKMECLLCNSQFLSVNPGKKDVWHHKVDENNPYFLDLFEPDTIDSVCCTCNVKFDTCRKKNITFPYHYSKKQSGGRLQRARDLPFSILKRGVITYYCVNFDQPKDFYDFHSSDMVMFFWIMFTWHLILEITCISFRGILKL